MAGAVQFIGLENVMEAFEMREVQVWSIMQGKEFNHRGKGAEELRQYLELLGRQGTQATYSLRVYDQLSEPSEVFAKTDYTGSLNFKLNDTGAVGDVQGYSYRAKLEERIKKLEGGEHDEEETYTERIGNAVIGLVEQPDKLIGLINGIKSLMGMPMPGPMQLAGIGNVVKQFVVEEKNVTLEKNTFQNPRTATSVVHENNIAMTTDEKLQRLSAAIDTLESKDPKIIEHLEKLAKIAVNNPGTFKLILQNLEMFA